MQFCMHKASSFYLLGFYTCLYLIIKQPTVAQLRATIVNLNSHSWRVFEIRFKLLGAAFCFICSCPLLLHAFVAVLRGRSGNGVEAGHALEVIYYINDTK